MYNNDLSHLSHRQTYSFTVGSKLLKLNIKTVKFQFSKTGYKGDDVRNDSNGQHPFRRRGCLENAP